MFDPKIQCNKCDTVFEHEGELEWVFDVEDQEEVHGCPDCKTDQYLMDITDEEPNT